MRETIAAEAAARTSDEAHDASRAFHFAVAAATAERARSPSSSTGSGSPTSAGASSRSGAGREDWQDHDVEEHRAIVAALEAGDGERAARLMSEHVESAVRHWSPRADVATVEQASSRRQSERERDRPHRLRVLGAERLVDLRLQLAGGVAAPR